MEKELEVLEDRIRKRDEDEGDGPCSGCIWCTGESGDDEKAVHLEKEIEEARKKRRLQEESMQRMQMSFS